MKMKATRQTAEARQHNSDYMKAMWLKPDYRNKVVAAMRTSSKRLVEGGLRSAMGKNGKPLRSLNEKLRLCGVSREERKRVLAMEIVRS